MDYDHQTGLKLEKLNGERNYQNWKFQMKTILRDKQLWWVVEDQKGPVPDNANTKQQEDLKKDPKKLVEYQIRASAILTASIEFSQYSLIRYVEDTCPHEMWNRILTKFEPKTNQSMLQMTVELFQIKMISNESVHQYADRLEETVVRYESTNKTLRGTVNELIKCNLFLNGLSENFKACSGFD